MKRDFLNEEYEETSSKLFKTAFFKGGGGSSGGSTNTVEKADPWEGQQPFLTYGFDEARDRFESDSPSFFPGNTISPFNQNELAYQQSVVDYLGSGRPQGLQQGAENAVGNELFNTSNNPMLQATRGLAPYGQESLVAASNFTDSAVGDQTGASPLMQQMLSGSVAQNPFIQNANNAMAADAVSNFQQQVMPALRASQIAYQPGGSSRGDIASGIAAGNVGRSITDFANTNYMNAFNSAQQQQMGAAQLLEQGRGQRANEALAQGTGAFGIGLGGEGQINQNLGTGLGAYGAVSQQPIDVAGNLSDVGMQQRELSQQQLDEDINRFQFNQNIGDQKLANYMNLIQGNFGGTTVNTAERGGLGLAGSMGQLGGAVGALGGLFG
jgi:hypothetical protein